MQIYTVKSGDNLRKISDEFGVNIKFLMSDNGFTDESRLVVGQSLIIVEADIAMTVGADETLFSVAQKYGTTVGNLLRQNQFLGGNPNALEAGEMLRVSSVTEKAGELYVNGYVYPNIDIGLLRSELPFLTYVSFFTYGFKESGELLEIDDTALISLAYEYGTAPIMMISSYTESNSFSNELTSRLLSDGALIEKLTDNIIENMKEKGYYGLDADFEYIFPDDREKYVSFIDYLKTRLNAEGFPVWVALAPKTSEGQSGLLYEGIDYPALGKAANYVLCMTYEWGYTYGPPMAVAPINKVREVINYAVSAISPSEIFMGMPNYGYDWIIPFEHGRAARSIGNEEAIRIAAENNSEIFFDELSASPYFNYTDNGISHEVWFEDARSIDKKLGLISEKDLRGPSYWNLMRPFNQNFTLLNEKYDIVKLF